MERVSATRKALKSAILIAALLLLAGCEAAQTEANLPSGAQKVAVFEGGEVTQGQVQEQLDLLGRQSGLGEITPDSPQYQSAIAQIMPQLVTQEIAQAYAREHGITVTEREVEREIERIKDQLVRQARAQGQDIGREEAFRRALEQAGITEAQLREQIREQLPVQKVQERVAGDARPTEEEVRDYYEENREAQFTTPAQRCVRHILFNPDQRERAEEVKRRLEEGADFAELAREYSQDPGSREKGGDLGCIGRGETVPNFEEAAFGAEEGEVVGPVKTQFGYHVIKVYDVRRESTEPLSEVEDRIREQLAATAQAEKFQRWVERQEELRDIRYLPGYDPNPSSRE